MDERSVPPTTMMNVHNIMTPTSYYGSEIRGSHVIIPSHPVETVLARSEKALLHSMRTSIHEEVCHGRNSCGTGSGCACGRRPDENGSRSLQVRTAVQGGAHSLEQGHHLPHAGEVVARRATRHHSLWLHVG